MAFIGKPVALLILAGSLNGLILPLTIGVVLIASKRKDIIGDYKHPTWMLALGYLIVAVAGYAGAMSLPRLLTMFQ